MPDETGNEKSALDLYYIDREGGNFKATIFFKPYFYLDVKDLRRLTEVSGHLLKKFENCVIEQIDLEDLDLANHLSGKKHKFLKISFFIRKALPFVTSSTSASSGKYCRASR